MTLQPLSTLIRSAAPAHAGGAIIEARVDDDVPLGCECANPALQIERWGQEAQAQQLEQFY
jgi:hypothetical protein